jgi:hypothetical protein
VLDIGNLQHPLPHIRDQLLESLPKMKNLQELICSGLFKSYSLDVVMPNCDRRVLLVDPAVMAVLHQNTSLLKMSDNSCGMLKNLLLVPILDRNRMLHHVDSLLAQPPWIQSTSGLWPEAFARMKPTAAASQDHPDHHNVKNIGASAIFKIFRRRPEMLLLEQQQQR